MQNSAWNPIRQSCRVLPRVFSKTDAHSTLFLRHKSTAGPSPKDELNWVEYFEIRRKRRQWQTVFTIPCAMVGLIGGSLYFGSLQTDPMKPIMGIDPMMFYGGCTLLCMGGGFVIGPSIGSSMWRVMNRNTIAKIDARDRRFYDHIAKNRVEASLQSATNPIPDYYGEKVGSLRQYKQWLRDQSKYRRKAMLTEE
ncbi:mitochondrial import protein Pam17 [Mycena maculata]|uniref:Presequence translocated-associated motor subunit PAM17 n=1 Tax=Mycena maculata TaxID=230809 RepID=A0AAD7NRU0_9AGAR|nr:mitochondrial import protein Pam17 [Mycena maculata]